MNSRSEEDKKDDNASVASGDSITAYTPTHTTEQDISSRDNPSYAHDSFGPRAPLPGRTYMIRHRDSGKMLARKEGLLGLEDDCDLRTEWHWDCVQSLGWFGFKTISGFYLGRDGNFGFCASAMAHLPWEWIVVSPGHEGCYLQSPHWLSLRWVGIGEDGRKLVDATSSDQAALWEFVEV
ncbi:hypothetical protein NUW58_g6761 [Xylaria curta]|uniref:Uncharacterized protein n=1 Tax=Xylaria curta TaxID=42375 RepID=A0ACC1NQG0_9PEZI|nr:hypothetical protein NUW58_g6761 [Xylaria curta]